MSFLTLLEELAASAVSSGSKDGAIQAAEVSEWLASRPPIEVLDGWGEAAEINSVRFRELTIDPAHLVRSCSNAFALGVEYAAGVGANEVARSLNNWPQNERSTSSAWFKELDNTRGYFTPLAAMLGRTATTCPFSGETVWTSHCLPIASKDSGQVFLLYRFSSTKEFFIIVAGFPGSKMYLYCPCLNLLIRCHPDGYAWGSPQQMIGAILSRSLPHVDEISSYWNQSTKPAVLIGTLSNIGHFIWNELSGLIAFDDLGALPRPCEVLIYKHAFFDPLSALINTQVESSHRIKGPEDLLEFVLSQSLFIFKPTDTRVSEATAERIRRFAWEKTTAPQLSSIKTALEYDTLVWIGLRAHNKVWLDQADSIIALTQSLQRRGSVAVFIDGMPNCNDQFENLKALLPKDVQLFSGLNISLLDTISWAFSVDFYLATIGTGLTFVTWLAAKPGIAQSEQHHLKQLDFWSDVRPDAPPPLAPRLDQVEDVGEGLYGDRMYCNYRIPSDVIMELFEKLEPELDAARNPRATLPPASSV